MLPSDIRLVSVFERSVTVLVIARRHIVNNRVPDAALHALPPVM